MHSHGDRGNEKNGGCWGFCEVKLRRQVCAKYNFATRERRKGNDEGVSVFLWGPWERERREKRLLQGGMSRFFGGGLGGPFFAKKAPPGKNRFNQQKRCYTFAPTSSSCGVVTSSEVSSISCCSGRCAGSGISHLSPSQKRSWVSSVLRLSKVKGLSLLVAWR